MKDSLISFARRKFGGAASKEEILVIHQIARNRFGNDFPNPKREGCPSKESSEKMIGEKKLPGEDLRNHLFGCSECFIKYRKLIERSKPIETANQPAAFFSPLKLVLAGSLSLCLIAFGIWLLSADSNSSESIQVNNQPSDQNYRNSNEEQSLKTEAAENARINPTVTVKNLKEKPAEINKNAVSQTNQTNKNKNKNERPTTVKESEPQFLAKNEVEIDLNNQAIWRNSANAVNRKVFQLEPKKPQLRIKLPKENPAGLYEVFIVDEFGKLLTKKKTIRARNQNLLVLMNLRKIAGNQKRLCFAPVGEIPDCVLVNITPKKVE